MTSPQPAPSPSTSVFKALGPKAAPGSWADRIKDSNGNPTSVNGASSSTNGDNSKASHTTTPLTPNGTHSNTATSNSTSNKSSSSSSNPGKRSNGTNKASPTTHGEDEGAWETVQQVRHKPKQEERRGNVGAGSNSRDWRDRPDAKSATAGERNGGEDGKRSASIKPAKKGQSSTAVSPVVEKARAASTPRSTFSSPSGTTSVWGKPVINPSNVTPSTSSSSVTTTPKINGVIPGVLENTPSPSVNGATTATNTSISSPSLSADANSGSSAPTGLGYKAEVLDEEPSWRSRMDEKKSDISETVTIPAVPKQPAPPPPVNAWEVRKKLLPSLQASTTPQHALGPSPMAKNSTSDKTPVLQFGSVSSPIRNEKSDELKVANKKKKKIESVPAITDTTLWPDVAQAAEVAKAAEEKKEKAKEKREEEGSVSVAEESTGTGKKAKWTPIPAAELQAAADKVAENQRRARMEQQAAKKRESVKAESSVSPIKGKTPRKGASTSTVPDPKRAGRPSRDGTSEIRLPPLPAGHRGGVGEFKPVFGSLTLDGTATSDVSSAVWRNGSIYKESTDGGENKAEIEAGAATTIVNGGYSEPISRQISRHSAIETSPQRARTAQSSPHLTSQPLEAPPSLPGNPSTSMRMGPGPYSKVGTSTAPLPQHPFNTSSSHNMPSRPRGREGMEGTRGRGGFARRGGFRSNSAVPMGGPGSKGGFTHPQGNQANLPNIEGMPYGPGINMYQRGYNSMAFYPGNQFVQQGPYDPMGVSAYSGTGQYGRGGPPPPMPMTIVPNLDALRFYVLGQVEFYFSMQNLAMDFFLRQQMDSEGWIDISMISSFNRLKSLTPDQAIIKEVMELSSMLEVRDECVRLFGDYRKWVLPDAKPSKFGPESTISQTGNATPATPTTTDEIDAALMMGIPADLDPSQPGYTFAFSPQQNGVIPLADDIMGKPLADIAAGVENALMKSGTSLVGGLLLGNGSSTVPPSSSASVLNGDADEITPGTSMSGEIEDGEKS